MDTSALIQPILTTRAAVFSDSLKEGGLLFLRVIDKNPDGTYDVFAKGIRFAVSATRDLQKGESFMVRLSLSGNTIFLSPETASALHSTENANSFVSRSASEVSLFLSQHFAELGLPADVLSLRFINFFMQMGMQFDTSAMRKARVIAASFPGREAVAGEIALLLLEKGIEPSTLDVAHLLIFLDGSALSDTSFFSSSHKKNDKNDKKDQNELPFMDLFVNGEEALDSDGGLLTVLNHCMKGNKHWILLPYAVDEYTGTIRILIDMTLFRAEKMLISAYMNFSDQHKRQWFFDVDFLPDEISVLSFCTQPEPNDAQKISYERVLKTVSGNFLKCTVQYNQNCALNGFFFTVQTLHQVNMEV